MLFSWFMIVEFKKDWPVGTIVRVLKTGLEGIVVTQAKDDTTGRDKYTVEMRHGETEMFPFDQLAPADHGIHQLLEIWHAEAKEKGFGDIYIGIAADGHWRCFFGSGSNDYFNVTTSNRHLEFKYIWWVREGIHQKYIGPTPSYGE
jgi:hypothetical protein